MDEKIKQLIKRHNLDIGDGGVETDYLLEEMTKIYYRRKEREYKNSDRDIYIVVKRELFNYRYGYRLDKKESLDFDAFFRSFRHLLKGMNTLKQQERFDFVQNWHILSNTTDDNKEIFKHLEKEYKL